MSGDERAVPSATTTADRDYPFGGRYAIDQSAALTNTAGTADSVRLSLSIQVE
jgi:hypothetical protein